MSEPTALPFLPGNSFSDLTKTKFHRSNSLHYRNGYALPLNPTTGIGGEPLKANQLTEADLDELSTMRPTLTYGNASRPAPVEFVPAHVAFDKKVLRFDAFFKQTVHESPDEYYRVRVVKLYYYLEDDSIAVVEPPIQNSGIPQGKLIKRQRLPKNDFGDCWHWKDLNIGIDVAFYGKLFHIYNCDKWTHEYMLSEGIELNPPEEHPSDPYTMSRSQPLHTFSTPTNWDKLKQFLTMDRKVLRFYCVWDDRDNTFGEMKPFVIHYYLVDNTVEIREIHEPNDGRDPFPVLLCRQKLPRNRDSVPSNFPSSILEISESEVSEWFSPKDFSIGKTIIIMGRKFLICDCDEFTKQYYHKEFQVRDFEPVSMTQPTPELVKREIPPYNGFGSLEDSMQSCFSLIPQPPKKDFIKMLENDGKVLRYVAKLETTNPVDQTRVFIISFWLSDDTLSIFESSQRNSGILAGKFLERSKIIKPGRSIDNPDYYQPRDFTIGATIQAFEHKFIITNADQYVLKYMEANRQGFSDEAIAALKQKYPKYKSSVEEKQAQ